MHNTYIHYTITNILDTILTPQKNYKYIRQTKFLVILHPHPQVVTMLCAFESYLVFNFHSAELHQEPHLDPNETDTVKNFIVIYKK